MLFIFLKENLRSDWEKGGIVKITFKWDSEVCPGVALHLFIMYKNYNRKTPNISRGLN